MTAGIPNVAACVFDAYGTLLDLGTAIDRCRPELGDKADVLAAVWRTKQLEYSWVRSLMGRYEDFWTVTGAALDVAMAAAGVRDPGLRSRLMQGYLELSAFPDVRPALAAIRAAGIRTAVLSNGSPEMLAAAIDGAGLRRDLDAVLSVHAIGVYKPHPSVYQLACDRLHVPKERICFVSGNGWDASGAATFGFKVAWINRTAAPWEPYPAEPHARISGLGELAGLLGIP